jgi:hypothetical protein
MNTAILYDGYHALKYLRKIEQFKYLNIDFRLLNKQVLKHFSGINKAEGKLIYSGWFQGIHSSYLDNINKNWGMQGTAQTLMP